MPGIAERLNIRVSRRHAPPGAALLPIAGRGSELKATADGREVARTLKQYFWVFPKGKK